MGLVLEENMALYNGFIRFQISRVLENGWETRDLVVVVVVVGRETSVIKFR